MGGSKKVTVGYKYYLGMHMVLCHGPIDKLIGIYVDKRVAWRGSVQSGRININAPDLFGGESREGGISGAVDLLDGNPAQGPNSYLQSRIGGLIPSFRGVVSVVLRQVYLGVNPYLKLWSFRAKRIHVRQNGIPQWYDEKSEISVANFNFEYDGIWRYKVVEAAQGGAPGVPSEYINPNYDDSSWLEGRGGFGSGGPGAGLGVGTYVSPGVGKGIWIRKKIYIPIPSLAAAINVTIYHDDGRWLWWNGQPIETVQQPNYFHSTATIPAHLVKAENTIVMQVLDSIPGGSPSNIYAGLALSSIGGELSDMNPAHIIRECLTDPDWGMGYSEADIDDATFKACADTLYDERMGISLIWDRQTNIEDFIREIVKHIDGALYVDRFTGKFTLKLIRNDYDENNLLLLDEYNIDKITDFTKPTFGELTNSVSVNYWDSQTNTNASLTVQDIALAQMQQATINTTVQYPGFTNKYIATLVAQRDLKTLSTPLISCTIYANTEASELNIGDVFKLTWPDYEVDSVVMRVTGIAYGNGKMNRVRITATQDVFALPDSLIIAAPEPEWENPNKPPEPLTNSLVFEVPYLELVQQLGQADADSMIGANAQIAFLGAAALRPQASAINARFMVNDGPGFEDVGAVDFCPGATLAEALPLVNGAGQIVETVQLSNITDEENIEPGEWCQINDEILAVVSLEDGLLTVKRGCLDTVPQRHPSGSTVFFWDAFAAGAPTEYVESDEIDVRLLTATGGGILPLEQAMTTTVEMAGRAARPYPPGDFKVNDLYFPQALSLSEESILSLTWVDRNRVQQTGETLIGFLDSAVTIETGVTYEVVCTAETSQGVEEWYRESVGQANECDIDLTENEPPEDAVSLTLKVYSKRDDLYCLYPQTVTILVFEPPYNVFGVYVP